MRPRAFISMVLLVAMAAAFVPRAAAQHEHPAGNLEKLGKVSFPVSCDPSVQSQFTSAVAMLHSFWRFELFSGRRSQVQTSTVEIDRMDEVLFIPKPSGCVFHPLDLGIQRFAGGIRDLML